MVTDLLLVVLTRLLPTVHNKLLRACCKLSKQKYSDIFTLVAKHLHSHFWRTAVEMVCERQPKNTVVLS